MLYSVTIYKNTGFDLVNRPSDPSVLNLMDSVTYESDIYDWQNFDKPSITIRTTWALVADADYLKLHATDTESYDTYFIVTNIQMLNPKTALISLALDALSSCGGINNMGIISGWAKRAHVSDDTIFSNTSEEPFVPQQEMIIDGMYEYQRTSTAEDILVGATIQINESTKAADTYSAPADSYAVYVPRVESVKGGSTCNMILPAIGTKTKQLPNLQLFNFNNEMVQEGIQSTRSLGLSDAITACYTLGNRMHSQIEYLANGEIASITGVREDVTITGIPYQFSAGTIRNNKVYALYNLLRATSTCSGDAADYKMADLYMESQANPIFTFFTDPSPKGCPYMQPKYFQRAENRAFLQCMKGMPWQNTPYSFDTRNGDLLETATFERKRRDNAYNIVGSTLQGAISVGGALLSGNVQGALSSSVSSTQSTRNAWRQASDDEKDYQEQRNLIVPEIAFPRDQSIQDYVGNGFFFYRTRLSDSDCIRLDRFLTQFGYSIDKKLERSDFTNRQYFNFVQASGVQLDTARPLRMRAQAAVELSNGVRLWHTKPTASAMEYNPVRS